MKHARVTFVVLLLAAGMAAAGQPAENVSVLVMARGNAGLELADPKTLNSLGFLRTGQSVHNSLVRPDGRMLVLAQARPSDPRNCCALYALDLASHKVTFLIWPSQGGALSPDGGRLYTQRGNTAIDVVDLEKLQQAPSIGKPGKNYALFPSPDGRWLFGVTDWPGQATLEILDLHSGQATRALAVPDLITKGHTNWPPGVWMGDTFYLFAYAGGQARLWAIRPDTEKLTEGRRVNLSGLGKPCNCKQASGGTMEPVPLNLLAAGGRLILYESFRGKLDRRPGKHGTSVSGGAYVIEPATGEVKSHVFPSLYFSRLVASADGSELYGLASQGSLGTDTTQLVKLDARDGRVLASRQFADPAAAYSLALAAIPAALVPHGEVRLEIAAEPASKK